VDNVFELHPAPSAKPQPEPLWREVVGEQLRSERVDRGERIADVAARAGIAPQYLSELERGLKDPSSEVLAAVSGALGLSVLDLSGRAGLRLGSASGRGQGGPVRLAA
jgi:transcriptional regulator with XRE-family HTH domain